MTTVLYVRSRPATFIELDRELLAERYDVIDWNQPGRWGNPFTIGDCRDAGWRGTDEQIAARCKAAFAAWLTSPSWRVNWDGPESERRRAAILSAMPALRGKNLACWCALDAPCHADVLLELANRPICEAIP